MAGPTNYSKAISSLWTFVEHPQKMKSKREKVEKKTEIRVKREDTQQQQRIMAEGCIRLEKDGLIGFKKFI